MSKINYQISFTIDVFLFFILVNGFFIASNINSTFLVPFIIVMLSFSTKKLFPNFIYLLSHKQVCLIWSLLFFLLFGNFVVLFLHLTYDLSYTKNIVSLIISFFIIIFFLAFIFTRKIGISYSAYIEKIIVHGFLVQSAIQVLAFIFPSFANVIHFFYSEYNYLILYEGYGGIRGLALTGSPGWGLAVGYGLAFLFFTKQYLLDNKINLKSMSYAVILILGAFFSGRSAFVGAILSILLFLFCSKSLIFKFKSIFYFVFTLPFFALSIFVFPDFYQLLIEKVFPFVFEFIYKFQSSGEIETGSTNVLIEMWQVDIPIETFLFGDGVFMIDGHYYKKTDVGYLRNILFGGIFWSFFIWLIQIGILQPIGKHKKYIFSNDRLLVVFCLFLCFIYEAKAMTVVFSKYAFIIMVIYSLSFIGNAKQKNVTLS